MNRLEQKDLRNGMKVWCADYDYTTRGTKCTLNIEPVEYEVTKASANNWYAVQGKKVNSKSDKETYLPTNKMFATRQDAETHYKACLCDHVKHLLERVSYFATIGVMSKRLNKFGLAELDRELKDISKFAEDITNKINNA